MPQETKVDRLRMKLEILELQEAVRLLQWRCNMLMKIAGIKEEHVVLQEPDSKDHKDKKKKLEDDINLEESP